MNQQNIYILNSVSWSYWRRRADEPSHFNWIHSRSYDIQLLAQLDKAKNE